MDVREGEGTLLDGSEVIGAVYYRVLCSEDSCEVQAIEGLTSAELDQLLGKKLALRASDSGEVLSVICQKVAEPAGMSRWEADGSWLQGGGRAHPSLE